MRLAYLFPDAAWAFVFGGNTVRLDDDCGGSFPLFYMTRAEAVEAARMCGLTVGPVKNGGHVRYTDVARLTPNFGSNQDNNDDIQR